LPDIGRPFDVRAFRAFTIPDDRNAYNDYRRASSLFEPWALYAATAGSHVDLRARWSQAVPRPKGAGRGQPQGAGGLSKRHRSARRLGLDPPFRRNAH
jgi:hypothetical protein